MKKGAETLQKAFSALRRSRNDGGMVEDPLLVLEQNLGLTRTHLGRILKKLEKRGLIMICKSGVPAIGGGLITRAKILKDKF